MTTANHRYSALALAVLLMLLAACTGETAKDARPAAQSADSVYTNAIIWTGVAGASPADSMAILGDKILAVGAQADMTALTGEYTRIVDLDGAFVTPGLIDNHTHFLFGGFGLASVDLRDAGTPQEFARRIGEFAQTQPAGRWISEGNWDHELWGGELPTKDWIDALTPDHPVYVMRLDGHMALVNSKALELAGITADTETPVGGEIIRDANGNPTGILKDTAMFMIDKVVPVRSDGEYDAALQAAQNHALEHGLTQVHDISDWPSFAALQRARKNGTLRLRVYSILPLADWQRVATYVENNGLGDDWLRWGAVKGFVDGSLGSTTAWFYAPYTDAPDTSGFPLSNTEELNQLIVQADAAGLHLAVHAIGDRANDWLLDTYADVVATNGPFESLFPERRFRIEHAQHLSAAAIERFAKQGVVPSVHPYHAIDDGRWAEDRIGNERIQRTYAFKSLLEEGAKLSFGSDWAVAPLDPIAGIYAAVTRRTFDGANPDGWVPQEKITVEQALTAFTQGSAYAGYQEALLGTLEAGKLADFVVLSQDLFAIDPNTIADVKVLRTIVGGEEKFRH